MHRFECARRIPNESCFVHVALRRLYEDGKILVVSRDV